MKLQSKKSWAKKRGSFWNCLTALERLHFVLNHQDEFLRAQLVKPGELLAAQVAPESAREYIIEREESPFFAFLDIKKSLDDQKAVSSLETLLTSV